MQLTLSVLAAGMGSRYGGLKQIDPFGPHGETILDYSVYDAKRAGFDRVVFVIRRNIEKEFRDTIGRRFENQIDVAYAFQELTTVPDGFAVPPTREKPWGTAHAILAASDVIDAPFAVINADDFYGADSYRVLADFLKTTRDDAKAHFAMVGFILRNTLSEHGHVARGICTCDDQLFLQSLTEHTRILKRGNAAVYIDTDNQEHPLTGHEWVSMNMWGFTPSIFAHLDQRFRLFLEQKGQDDKAEFYIPFAVDELTNAELADVRILPSTAQWFGVTYRDDKPSVVSAINALIESGQYPAKLWS